MSNIYRGTTNTGYAVRVARMSALAGDMNWQLSVVVSREKQNIVGRHEMGAQILEGFSIVCLLGEG